jgi:predicted transcriptional regulator
MKSAPNADQLGLFDVPAPFARGSETSEEAARSVEVDARTLRGIVLAFIRGRGERGATCDEIEVELGLRHQTASARIRELVQADYLADRQARRSTRSGRRAVVWRESHG